MMLRSGSHGTSTTRLALDFCRFLVKKLSSPAVSPPSMDIRTVPWPSMQTAECTSVALRPEAFSFAKLSGLASISTPLQPKHCSSIHVFENFLPSRAPNSTNTPGFRSPPTERTSVGSSSTSSSCIAWEAARAHVARA